MVEPVGVVGLDGVSGVVEPVEVVGVVEPVGGVKVVGVVGGGVGATLYKTMLLRGW